MSLQEQIQTDIAVAMRSGDALRRDVLRMASSAAYNVEKKQGRPLTDDEMLGVLTREVKTRRDRSMPERQSHLDQPSHSSGRFRVTDIRLDGTDTERRSVPTRTLKHRC